MNTLRHDIPCVRPTEAGFVLPAPVITQEAFAPFGTLMIPLEDGTEYSLNEPALELSAGRPRFYIMRLRQRGLSFRRITRHTRVTQCLLALDAIPWCLAVAPPRAPDDPNSEPDLNDLRAFTISGFLGVKLHSGTWHAGPLFDANEMLFANLELTNTNEIDHQNSDLVTRFGASFRLLPEEQ